MIKISYDEPLVYGSIISFNINGKKFEGEIHGKGNSIYVNPRSSGLIDALLENLNDNLRNFFSETLGTSIDKYEYQFWPEESLKNLKKVFKAMEEYTPEDTIIKGVKFEKPLRDKSKVTFLLSKEIINSHVNFNNQKTAFIWIEDYITPDQLMINLCGETLETVYSNAGATITSSGGWPWSTLEDLEKVLDYINEKCHYNVQKPINNPIKQQQNGNEIKLQRTKGIIRSGKVPKGCGICGKIHKATISSRPLENSAISG